MESASGPRGAQETSHAILCPTAGGTKNRMWIRRHSAAVKRMARTVRRVSEGSGALPPWLALGCAAATLTAQ